MAQRITFQAVGNTNEAVAQAAVIHFQEVGFSTSNFNTFRLNCTEAGITVRLQGRPGHLTIQLVS